MDKIVVDSSVVIKWFVIEPLSAEARRRVHFEKPCVARKKKAAAKQRKSRLASR